MITGKDNPVRWALLIEELSEAKDHIENLASQMASEDAIDLQDFEAQIAHVYAHLNRIWNSRDLTAEIDDESWEAFSSFPTDIRPVG